MLDFLLQFIWNVFIYFPVILFFCPCKVGLASSEKHRPTKINKNKKSREDPKLRVNVGKKGESFSGFSHIPPTQSFQPRLERDWSKFSSLRQAEPMWRDFSPFEMSERLDRWVIRSILLVSAFFECRYMLDIHILDYIQYYIYIDIYSIQDRSI